MALADLKFSWPFSVPEDPQQESEEGQANAETQATKVRLLRLVEGCDGLSMSAERLAWANLWTRAVTTVRTLETSTADAEPLPLYAAQRSALELHVHLQLVFRPLAADGRFRERFGAQAGDSEAAWQAVMERLRGMAAWALMQDRAARLHQRRRLGAIYDPRPAEELRKDPIAAELHRVLLGEVPTDSRDDLIQARDAADGVIEANLRRLTDWLASPDLEQWGAPGRFSPADPPSLGSCLGETEESFMGFLRLLDVQFAYLVYSESSSVLHGSTSDELGIFTETEYFPAIGLLPNQVERIRASVLADLNRSWALLAGLRQRVWFSAGER